MTYVAEPDARYLAAAVQFEPVLFDKAHNIARLVELVEDAAAAGAKLITTPEMGLSGYCFFNSDEAATMAESIPGPSTEIFAGIAAAHDCHIVIGMPERDLQTGLLYNSGVLIGPQGVIGTHRKSHGYIAEPKWATPGDLGHQVFDTALGRIAILICMDIHFLETARVVALEGADVICHISAWLAERTPAPYWISRAYENSCYLMESNRWGLERGVQFSGGSCIIGPDATVLAVRDTGDGVVTAEIDLTARRLARDSTESALSGRRPELYRDLQINTFLWNPRDFFTLYGNHPIPPGRTSAVAVVQRDFATDKTRNVAVIAEAFQDAVADGAHLVVFPELSVSGPPTAAVEYPDSVDSEGVMRPLLAAAARSGGYLVVGVAERGVAGTAPYNSAVLIGPEGVVAVHRKIHLGADDEMFFTAGDSWTIADIPVGRVALLLGDDVLRPESGRVAALQGCDVIAVPARLSATMVSGHAGSAVPHSYPIPRGATHLHWHHMRVRAGENNVYLAYANPPEFGGHSGIFGPDTFEFPRREAVADTGSEVLMTQIDITDGDGPYPANIVRRKDLVSMRLPHHYRALTALSPASVPAVDGADLITTR